MFELYAALGTAGVAAIWAGVQTLRLRSARADLALERVVRAAAQEDRDRIAAARKIEAAAAEDARLRIEEVVTTMRHRLVALETELATCSAPEATRARLRELLR